MTICLQARWLFLLAIPIAWLAWTVIHEEVFREPGDYCLNHSVKAKTLLQRKFFYLFTCEYCFSHYVIVLFLLLTGYKLLLNSWSGYIIVGVALVWIANIYMSLFGLIRQDVKKEKMEINLMDKNEIPKDDTIQQFK